MDDLQHGLLKIFFIKIFVVGMVLSENRYGLRAFMPPPQDQDLLAEFGDFRHVMGNIKKTPVSECGLHFQNDAFLGDFIDIGQTFIHDQQVEFL